MLRDFQLQLSPTSSAKFFLIEVAAWHWKSKSRGIFNLNHFKPRNSSKWYANDSYFWSWKIAVLQYCSESGWDGWLLLNSLVKQHRRHCFLVHWSFKAPPTRSAGHFSSWCIYPTWRFFPRPHLSGEKSWMDLQNAWHVMASGMLKLIFDLWEPAANMSFPLQVKHWAKAH